jgi:hypothetical protein
MQMGRRLEYASAGSSVADQARGDDRLKGLAARGCVPRASRSSESAKPVREVAGPQTVGVGFPHSVGLAGTRVNPFCPGVGRLTGLPCGKLVGSLSAELSLFLLASGLELGGLGRDRRLADLGECCACRV